MEQLTTVGLDLAKDVIAVCVLDVHGAVVERRVLRRDAFVRWAAQLPSCKVAMEACGSAHYWGRELRALGHEVRLIPAAYMKPFVRRNKNDARDAAAICTAIRRPDMRFVAIKSVESQASRGLERSRELLVRQHTQLMNSVRSQLAELGIIAAQGRRGFAELTQLVVAGDERIPAMLLSVLSLMLQQIDQLRIASAAIEVKIMAMAKADPAMQRLATIPGVGGLTALLRQVQQEGRREAPPPLVHHSALKPEEREISPASVLLAQVRADSPDGKPASPREVLASLVGEERAAELIGESVIVVDSTGADPAFFFPFWSYSPHPVLAMK